MIPDKSLSISAGSHCSDGLAVLYRSRVALPMLFWMPFAGNTALSLDTPFKDYPKKIQDIILYGTGGHSVKVYYKGQRGEGVYDVAFPGPDQGMWSSAIRRLAPKL